MTKRPEVVQLALDGQLEAILKGINQAPDFRLSKCAGMSLKLFFTETAHAEKKAKAICAQCPIMEMCGAWAVNNAEHGVYGGLTAKERKFMRGTVAMKSTSSIHDLTRELNFVMGASAKEVSLRYGVDSRTVVRWRNILRPMAVAV